MNLYYPSIANKIATSLILNLPTIIAFSRQATAASNGNINSESPFVFLFFGVFLILWLMIAYSLIRMLANVKRGGWSGLIEMGLLWQFGRVHEHLKPAGIRHYRRAMKCVVALFVGVLAVIIFMIIGGIPAGT